MSYKFGSKFSAHRGSGNAEDRLSALETELSRTHQKLNSEFTNLERTSGGSQINVIVGNTTSKGSSVTSVSGIIAILNQTVTAGVNVIIFPIPLSSAIYGGFLVLSDSTGMQIQMSPLELIATSMTANGFVYNAPQAGQLNGFAMVAN